MPGDLLPLFPLQTVLFPLMPLPLHIFEPRYKAMINRCIEEDRPFGVLLIQEGSEVGEPAVPYMVGTLARIRAVERLDEGRMNLMAEGTERFRLLDYVKGQEPYLVGMIESLQDEVDTSTSLTPLVEEIRELFHTYLKVLLACVGRPLPDYELPEDPEEMSFVVGAAVQSGSAERQAMLELTNTAARLRQQRTMLQEETARLQAVYEANLRPPKPLTAEDRKPYQSEN